MHNNNNFLREMIFTRKLLFLACVCRNKYVLVWKGSMFSYTLKPLKLASSCHQKINPPTRRLK